MADPTKDRPGVGTEAAEMSMGTDTRMVTARSDKDTAIAYGEAAAELTAAVDQLRELLSGRDA